jgi:hypothetical protein
LARLNVAGACGDGLAVLGQSQQTIVVDVADGVTAETKLDGFHCAHFFSIDLRDKMLP